ncbi:hypothetical protein CQW23_23452 [Capsicum baccatum]|uniref:Uncharacterized protein n=1 Tax=Capsicum baccatum TaxID=33114 RepID=A0A2G2VS13_CAPBA|nr:hypothetical protein CQW23_23452 [Capsicum baccatum]
MQSELERINLAKVNDLDLSKNNSEKLLREGTRSGNEQLEVVGYGQDEKISGENNTSSPNQRRNFFTANRGATEDGDERDLTSKFGNDQVQSAGDGQRYQVSMVVASPGERVDEEQAIMVDTSIINRALIALPVLEDSEQREHQSKNVTERKLVQDSNCTMVTKKNSPGDTKRHLKEHENSPQIHKQSTRTRQ